MYSTLASAGERKLIVLILIHLLMGDYIFGQVYDARDMVMTPGRDESEMNFNWYSTSRTESLVQLASKAYARCPGFPKRFFKSFKAETAKAVSGFYHNKATITGLSLNSDYLYRLGDGNGKWTDVYDFTTHDYRQFSFLAIGDAQIGCTEINEDTKNWKDTLNKALDKYPKSAFILSVGDQVESAGNEEEFASFLSPVQLKNIPVAPAIGNHETWADNSYYHFNLPNHLIKKSELKDQASGSGNYFFSYGTALFIILNSNSIDPSSFKNLMDKAVKENPHADWKIVMFHHDIYGSGFHTLELYSQNLREVLVPLFDSYGVDIAFNGHDHSYTRSHVMYGDKPRLDQNYDSSGALMDPDGTVYFTLNSSSASKFYTLNTEKADYEAFRRQVKVPSFSHVSIKNGTLSLDTFRTDTMALVDSFSLVKSSIKKPYHCPCRCGLRISISPSFNARKNRFWKSLGCFNSALELHFDKEGQVSEINLVNSEIPGHYINRIKKMIERNKKYKQGIARISCQDIFDDHEYYIPLSQLPLFIKNSLDQKYRRTLRTNRKKNEKKNLLGDVNNDNDITIIDALLIARYYVGFSIMNFNLQAADINNNGVLDMSDALLIARYSVGGLSYFPGHDLADASISQKVMYWQLSLFFYK